MKTILILMDSLNRHSLKLYNNDSEVRTPHITRLAKKSVIFDNHWLGSAPCMPARRDIFTGRLNFLERNWGPIEPFDVTLPTILREHGVFSHIITDHYHYFEIGGENYCQLFNTWDFIRGQEKDPWISKVKEPPLPSEYIGRVRPQYELNRSTFEKEEDYPSPKTFQRACDWLDDNHDSEDFFLMIESFDPHEPFDCPKEYLEDYEDDYNGPRYDWPDYKVVEESEEALQHIQKCYGATVTMIDNWLGKLLDKMDEYDLWEDTLVIFTTDHGHLLGEHGYMAKNYMHVYNELAHLPFFIHLPGDKQAGRRVNTLTQNIDLMATVLDYYNINIPETVTGYSLKNTLDGSEEPVRDMALFGYHGKAVNMTDGKYTYFKSPEGESNHPLFHYTAMPTTLRKYLGDNEVEHIKMGRYLDYTCWPVYKIPVSNKNCIDDSIAHVKDSLIFNIEEDYGQHYPIYDSTIQGKLNKKLIKGMKEAQAPKEQYERLGLSL